MFRRSLSEKQCFTPPRVPAPVVWPPADFAVADTVAGAAERRVIRALMTAQFRRVARRDRQFWGRIVESAVIGGPLADGRLESQASHEPAPAVPAAEVRPGTSHRKAAKRRRPTVDAYAALVRA